MAIKVIITGATGMVGEGVLMECLANAEVEEVLLVGRKAFGRVHPKLKELLVPDFMELDGVKERLSGYDGCFYCAGVSSVGMKEPEYTRVTYDVTLHFAEVLAGLNPGMVFDYVSGSGTDSSEKGRVMWARVKGRTENALMRLGFRRVYAFRPGYIGATEGQRNVMSAYKYYAWLIPVLYRMLPNQGCTMRELGLAMINSVLVGYPKQVLEVKDIKTLAAGAIAESA
jgi:nucleoside-diphosphate-sugar epimerase